MSKMNIKTGDTVVILTGDKDNRGKTGKVMQISPKEGKVIVEGLNMGKKHVKARKPGDPAGRIPPAGKLRAGRSALSGLPQAGGSQGAVPLRHRTQAAGRNCVV